MRIKRLAVGDFVTNCYIVFSEKENSVMLIDPAFNIPDIERYIGDRKTECIFLTHGHIDHIYEMPALKEKHGATVYCGIGDREILKDRSLYAPYGIMPECENREYPVDCFLKDGDKLHFAEYEFNVLSLPGHTPGCTALLCDNVLFSGDVLFYRSCGRTDFPLSSDEDMRKSLKKLSLLSPDTTVYPGHGFTTSIGRELQENPYMNFEV